jgi:hypothetical protein
MKKQKQSEIKKMMNMGMGLGVSNLAISALPQNDVTANVSAGYANFSKVFPAYGTLAGTTVLVKQSKKLLKSTKKLKL